MAKKSKVVQMSGSQPSAAAAAPKMQIDPFKLPTPITRVSNIARQQRSYFKRKT